jgi:hypothetical protein
VNELTRRQAIAATTTSIAAIVLPHKALPIIEAENQDAEPWQISLARRVDGWYDNVNEAWRKGTVGGVMSAHEIHTIVTSAGFIEELCEIVMRQQGEIADLRARMSKIEAAE